VLRSTDSTVCGRRAISTDNSERSITCCGSDALEESDKLSVNVVYLAGAVVLELGTTEVCGQVAHDDLDAERRAQCRLLAPAPLDVKAIVDETAYHR
jgi:hypothetical protein